MKLYSTNPVHEVTLVHSFFVWYILSKQIWNFDSLILFSFTSILLERNQKKNCISWFNECFFTFKLIQWIYLLWLKPIFTNSSFVVVILISNVFQVCAGPNICRLYSTLSFFQRLNSAATEKGGNNISCMLFWQKQRGRFFPW